MILSGPEIAAERDRGRLCIEPYSSEFLEPNSYGFHLGPNIIQHSEDKLDARRAPNPIMYPMPADGFCLYPHRLYLGSTLEKMGSDYYAATLYARRSVSTMGMWIQVSAPLGHTGAIIPWTLEIKVTHPIIAFPGMLIGKIGFWRTLGNRIPYGGKYSDSRDVTASRLSQETLY